jgi:hypothetical protein
MKSVLFVQLPPPRFSFREPPTNIPLAAGFLASAVGCSGRREFMVEILGPDVVDVLGDQGLIQEIVRRGPSVVAVTLYVWNVARSLFLASEVKRRLPETTLLVGGPEVTADNEWVLRHPAVDAGVFGEGESRVPLMLHALLSRCDLSLVPGVFFKDRGTLRVNHGTAPSWDLAAAAYPYLDRVITPSRDGTLFLETVRGCPFRCRYCYYHKAFPTIRRHPQCAIENVLDFAYDPDSPVREIYLMDPTFNARPGFRDLLRSLARRRGKKDVRLHTELRADLIRPEDARLLKDAGLASAEVGLQTVNPDALRTAGRKGHPDKVARGVGLLKESGIEVTTGIILGLPEDTPEGFQRTVNWLLESDAYSVVHPFVLSVLPGTDFRASAQRLGLHYDARPPYHVRSTPTFPEEDFRPALLACESAFSMELDYMPPPSLVDAGPGIVSDASVAPYVSTWIVDVGQSDWAAVLPELASKSTDPFTLWFRGTPNQRAMLSILNHFAGSNPYTCLHVVLEFPDPPSLRFFDKALEACALPSHFLNRSVWPLYNEGEIVSVNFWVILPDLKNHETRELLSEKYLSVATLIWDIRDSDPEIILNTEAPVLFSGGAAARDEKMHSILALFKTAHRDRWDQVLFRDKTFQDAWHELTGRSGDHALMTETIVLGQSV